MRLFLLTLLISFSICASTQPLLQAGDIFPNYVLRPVVNAPQPQLDVWRLKSKYIILNFWGTWCAPCIPEMEALSKLQRQYSGRLQIIGVSNDSKEKLLAYLKKRPTPIWLASDTASHLYRMAGLSYVGQSLILTPEKKIVAVMKTDSINAGLIEQILSGKAVKSNAETDYVSSKQDGDPFGVDSATLTNVSIRSYMQGKSSMSMTYSNTEQKGRRLTYYNICPTNLYRDAYNISSPSQIVYEVDKKKLCDYDNKATLVCFDLLVKPSQRDSLKIIMQQMLNRLLPYKARIEQRMIAVYVLSRDSSGLSPTPAAGGKESFSYSGNGFSGTSVPMREFVQYLANESGRPIVDETGLSVVYDIETKLTLRTKEEVLDSIKPLGLVLQKAEREMPVLVISAQ